jgi:phage/plasmid primase-like uncharacterized protein
MGNLTPFLADHVQKIDPPEVQLRNAMISSGQTPPESIVMDGTLRRYDDVKDGGDALWYVAFEDNIPGGAFGSWRDGTSINWRGITGRTYSMVEELAYKAALSEAKRKADTDKRIKNELAADDCAKIFDSLKPADSGHPYLSRKQVGPHSARINGRGELVVPMYSSDGEIISLQTISADGGKLFHKGGKVKGALLLFGAMADKVFVAEGFATSATIYESTGVCTVAAFSASNIPEVVGAIRANHPGADIVIVADNDKGGVGRNYADQAASKFGATVIMPPEIGQDANDYKLAGGDLAGLLTPQKKEWLVRVREFSKEPAPIKWLVKHWIQSDAMIMVHGPSGSGKTFVVLDWCLNMVTGSASWMGHKVSNKPVVYLAGEGHHGLRSRVSAWFERNKTPKELDPPFWLSKSGCDLNTPQGLQLVLTEIRSLPETPAMVVIDTLHRFLAGDENSAQDTKTMLDSCSIIQREFSCSTLLVHHTGVNEEAQHRARGSSAWRGALDIEISIQPPSAKGGPISIIQRKSKDAELSEPVFVELVQQEVPGWVDEDGEVVKSAVIIQSNGPSKKADKKETEAMSSLKSAWYATGMEILNGLPYVSRSAWRTNMENGPEERAESTAKNHVKASDPRSFAAKLIAENLIQEQGNGFVIIDEVTSSALTIVRGTPS